MNKVKKYGFKTKIVIVIWSLCAITFMIQFALRYSSETSVSYEDKRRSLYEKMARDLDENGAQFLENGETSQSLTLSDLFTSKDGIFTPVLKPANPPVRANVLHLSPDKAVKIAEAVKSIFSPHYDKNKAIWYQNSSLYHFSMFHASHHLTPVPALEEEIELEVKTVKKVAKSLCPINIYLEKVIITSTGVVLGCWQVSSGTEPAIIRKKLKNALPNAPKNQLYDNVILHTSFARILGYPNNVMLSLIGFQSTHEAMFRRMEKRNKSVEITFFNMLIEQLNYKIGRIQAKVSELWYVEEYDVLALALNGRMKVRKFQFGCSIDKEKKI